MRNVRLEVNKNEAEEEVGIAFLKKDQYQKTKKKTEKKYQTKKGCRTFQIKGLQRSDS